MSFTQTPNYSLYKPTINADNDQWGTHLNSNSDTLDTQLKAVSNAAAPSATNVGRNLIHNPYFNIAQRGVGPWTTGGYTLDRWNINPSTDTVSVTRQSLSDASRTQIGDEAATFCFSNAFTGNAAAGAYNYASHPIENVRRLAGKTVTVSFWANAGSALHLGINLLQYFGTGGSPSPAVWALTTGASVAIPGVTFARYSATFAVPSIIGKTVGTNGDDYSGLAFWYSSGATTNALAGSIGVQSGTVNLWGVQLEVGSVATPLEHIDPGLDLRNCQRSYQVGIINFVGYGVASGGAQLSSPFPVPMRATPTITPTMATTNISGAAMGAFNNAYANIAGTVTATGGYVLNASYTASADL